MILLLTIFGIRITWWMWFLAFAIVVFVWIRYEMKRAPMMPEEFNDKMNSTGPMAEKSKEDVA